MRGVVRFMGFHAEWRRRQQHTLFVGCELNRRLLKSKLRRPGQVGRALSNRVYQLHPFYYLLLYLLSGRPRGKPLGKRYLPEAPKSGLGKVNAPRRTSLSDFCFPLQQYCSTSYLYPFDTRLLLPLLGLFLAYLWFISYMYILVQYLGMNIGFQSAFIGPPRRHTVFLLILIALFSLRQPWAVAARVRSRCRPSSTSTQLIGTPRIKRTLPMAAQSRRWPRRKSSITNLLRRNTTRPLASSPRSTVTRL